MADRAATPVAMRPCPMAARAWTRWCRRATQVPTRLRPTGAQAAGTPGRFPTRARRCSSTRVRSRMPGCAASRWARRAGPTGAAPRARSVSTTAAARACATEPAARADRLRIVRAAARARRACAPARVAAATRATARPGTRATAGPASTAAFPAACAWTARTGSCAMRAARAFRSASGPTRGATRGAAVRSSGIVATSPEPAPRSAIGAGVCSAGRTPIAQPRGKCAAWIPSASTGSAERSARARAMRTVRAATRAWTSGAMECASALRPAGAARPPRTVLHPRSARALPKEALRAASRGRSDRVGTGPTARMKSFRTCANQGRVGGARMRRSTSDSETHVGVRRLHEATGPTLPSDSCARWTP